MSELPPAASDVERRKPVWEAWSELYLDTVLSPAMKDGMARALAASPYSVEQLRDILWSEVHPACARNLSAVAGEWASFDPSWLQKRILARPRRATWRPWLLDRLRGPLAKQAAEMLARVAALRAAPRLDAAEPAP